VLPDIRSTSYGIATGSASQFGTAWPATWSGKHFQIGVEAAISVNRDSGNNVGGLPQVHFYLDDLLPKLFEKPLLGDWP
jgi:hypothetical protein